jgi:hypothetical protein
LFSILHKSHLPVPVTLIAASVRFAVLPNRENAAKENEGTATAAEIIAPSIRRSRAVEVKTRYRLGELGGFNQKYSITRQHFGETDRFGQHI